MKKLTKLMWMFAALPLLMTACSNADEPDDIIDGGGDNGNVEAKALFVDDFSAVVNNGAIPNWTLLKVKGDRDWQGKVYTNAATATDERYAQASAHNGTATDYEYWMISPALSVKNATEKVVSFKTAKAYWQATSSLEVYLLSAPDANKKIEKLAAKTAAQADPDHTFISSGDIDLTGKPDVVYVAFRYVALGGASNSTTFRVDDFVFGKTASSITSINFSSANNTTVTVGNALDFTVQTTVANGVGATVLSANGAPAWVTFTDKGDGTATLKGTAPTTAEASTITITATNNGFSKTQAFTLTVKAASTGGGILNETCGTADVSAKPKVTDYTGWDSAAPISFGYSTGWPDVRATSTFNNHIWFAAGKDVNFQISNIAAAGKTGLKLSFKIVSNGTGNTNALTVTANGTALTIPSVEVGKTDYVVVDNVAIADADKIDLVFSFTATSNTVGYRLDDFKIEGTAK